MRASTSTTTTSTRRRNSTARASPRAITRTGSPRWRACAVRASLSAAAASSAWANRGARAPRFAHADDAAAADSEARTAHARQRGEPVLVIARGDALAVEFRRRVEVVVVEVEARILQ